MSLYKFSCSGIQKNVRENLEISVRQLKPRFIAINYGFRVGHRLTKQRFYKCVANVYSESKAVRKYGLRKQPISLSPRVECVRAHAC